MKRKSSLILLLVLLMGTCASYATGEIERYQREKLDNLAKLIAAQITPAISCLISRAMGGGVGVRWTSEVRTLMSAGVWRMGWVGTMSVESRERAILVDILHVSASLAHRCRVMASISKPWGPLVEQYNDELERQCVYRAHLQGMREATCKRWLSNPVGSISEVEWEMQYDGVTEWYKLNEYDIIEILRQLRADDRDQNDVESIERRKHTRDVMLDGLKNLLLARKDIEVIDLSGSGLTNEIARQLINVLDENHVVRRIDVSENDLSAELVAAFQSIVDRNIHPHNDMSLLSLAITQNSASKDDAFLAMAQNSAFYETSLRTLVAQSQANVDSLAAVAAHPNADAATLLTVAQNPATNLNGLSFVVHHPNANASVLIAVVDHANVDAVLLAEIERRLQAQSDTVGNVFANLTDLNNPHTNNATDVAVEANADADVARELVEGSSNAGVLEIFGSESI